MRKRISIIFIVISLLLLVSCNKAPLKAVVDGQLSVDKYISNLSDKSTAHLKDQTDLLLHPLKDAIALYGEDYEFICEGSYAEVKFPKAKCSFEVYIGEEFEKYNNTTTFNDCDSIEHLAFAQIEKVVFNQNGTTMTDGILIGMSEKEISEELNVEGISYSESSCWINTEYDENGNNITVRYITGQVANVECTVVFADDMLSRVEVSKPSRYLTEEKDDAEHGKSIIDTAFSFVSKNGLATFALEDLSYKGKIYSSHYDSLFYCWQFAKGTYKDYEICVEQNSPNRIYIASSSMGMPFVFWYDGEYVDPMLSFLGKWREHADKEYIDIKSISKEGIIVFDMYVYKDANTEDMVLLKNLSTTINEIPKTLDDYLHCENADEALGGDAQFYDGNVQSGYYSYAGDKIYLIDSLFLNFNGSVQYLPRSIGGRVGAGPLTIHIPNENTDYTQPSTWGYMENFGRDDPNKDNIISTNSAAGESVLNNYLNILYETSDLKYAELDYRYLYDYVFPVNDTTYHVWESKDTESPHYLYVDAANSIIIKEVAFNSISKHSKELIFKNNTTVSNKSYANQKFVTLDGKITINLEKRVITKTDSFVKDIKFTNLYFDTVRNNERFMFFTEIGNRFALNGYILFDHTTWGATLHITDSNIPDFEIGVYYLNAETFFLDPSIGVIAVADDNKEDKYLEDKVNESGKETKLVIREFSGKIIGYIYVDANGKKTVKEFSGKIVGYYYPDRDVTTDFYGKILARGDISSALLFK